MAVDFCFLLSLGTGGRGRLREVVREAIEVRVSARRVGGGVGDREGGVGERGGGAFVSGGFDGFLG